MDERARIAMLARVFAGSVAGVEVGIGDDAAVLDTRSGDARLVWTIDEQVEGTHFRRELASWRDVGWRSFMAAASDIAAMGATPWCALCALAIPDDVDDAALEAVAQGQRAAASAAGAPVVGGNLSRGVVLSLATTFLGRCERAVTRAGARPGDGLYLAGDVGLAAAGLRALTLGRGAEPAVAAAVAAWRTPHALIAPGRAMAAFASAAIDVSDGLARDLGHMADASGVQAVVDEASIRSEPRLADVAGALGTDPLELALYGGEDYALLVTSPVSIPVPGFRRIGEMRPGQGLVLRARDGERAIEPRGFDHFAGR